MPGRGGPVLPVPMKLLQESAPGTSTPFAPVKDRLMASLSELSPQGLRPMVSVADVMQDGRLPKVSIKSLLTEQSSNCLKEVTPAAWRRASRPALGELDRKST